MKLVIRGSSKGQNRNDQNRNIFGLDGMIWIQNYSSLPLTTRLKQSLFLLDASKMIDVCDNCGPLQYGSINILYLSIFVLNDRDWSPPCSKASRSHEQSIRWYYATLGIEWMSGMRRLWTKETYKYSQFVKLDFWYDTLRVDTYLNMELKWLWI